MAGKILLPPEERFMKFVSHEPNSGCWLWLGTIDKRTGYGHFGFGRRSTTAHRASWRIFIGPIPPGLFVCHKCDVKLCVNPDHLFVGTNIDNLSDMSAKGRGRKSRLGLPRGVKIDRRFSKPYVASFTLRRHHEFVGSFATPEEAHVAAEAARVAFLASLKV